MPYPNEHAARIKDAGSYDKVRRQSNKLGPGIDAIFGVKDGKSEIISIRFDKKKFTPAQARQWLKTHDFKAKMFEQASDKENKALVEIDLVITKANVDEDGNPSCLITASDTGPDRLGERTSLALFQNWIKRAETGVATNFLPPPRRPFLGISHYPDLDGYGEAGITVNMYIDGQQFKAKANFYTDEAHPLGPVLFKAVSQERDFIKKGGEVEQPIRISAAWWDLQHSHGDFIFTRQSLADKCPMCQQGAGDKQYLDGQLDHFASTRVPINPRTELQLEEKAMTKTRKDDAETIVGPEMAEELDKRAKLVGKSEAEDDEAPVMVIKADEDEDEAEVEQAQTEDEAEVEKAKGKKPFPGAAAPFLKGGKKGKKMDDDEDEEDDDKKMKKAKMADDEMDDEDKPKKMMGKKKKMKSAVALTIPENFDPSELSDDVLKVLSEAGLIEQMGDEMMEADPVMPFGGATSIKEAEAFIESREKMDKMYDNWGMLLATVGNIMSMGPDDGEAESDLNKRRLAKMSEAIGEFGSRIDSLKAGLADAYLIQPITDAPAPVVELSERSQIMTDQQTPQNDAYDVLKAQVEGAMENAEYSQEQKAEVIQKAIEGYVGGVKNRLYAGTPADIASLVAGEVQKAMGALDEKLSLFLEKQNQAPPQPGQAQPVQKSLQPTAVGGPTAASYGQPVSIRDISRRSVGLPQ